MKVVYSIEQHDNGIVLRSETEGFDPTSVVVMESDVPRTIGKELLGDIREVMNKHLASRVRVEINIIATEDNERGRIKTILEGEPSHLCGF